MGDVTLQAFKDHPVNFRQLPQVNCDVTEEEISARAEQCLLCRGLLT